MKSSRAFTLIELVFIIVILGILAAVAYPRIAPLREDAEIAKGKADVATIRAGIINERQTRIIKGDPTWISKANLDKDNKLFNGVLTSPLTNSNTSGNWYNNGTFGDGIYKYKVDTVSAQFDYNNSNGTFTCDRTNGTYGTLCTQLIQ